MMKHVAEACAVSLGIALLSSCGYHNVPFTQNPNAVVTERTAQAFVDQNGTFYPANWTATYGEPGRTGAYSLWEIADQLGLRDSLRAEERRTLDRFESFLSNKQRVFVFVHGFNNDQAEADSAYRLMSQAIAFEPGDAVVEFHWDGMVSNWFGGSGKIWFNAAGYSQLAGTKGLRSILNRIHGKKIFILAHSRGASVTLSALSDPPYSTSFAADTWTYHDVDVADNEPLAENGNEIKAIFLAPAVGLVDFRRPEYYTTDQSFRPFTPQLVSIHHTVNANDPILMKLIGRFSDNFNPTDLGYNPKVTMQLARHYSFITCEEFTGMNSHGFYTYVENPRFKRMLRDVGIGVQPPEPAPARAQEPGSGPCSRSAD